MRAIARSISSGDISTRRRATAVCIGRGFVTPPRLRLRARDYGRRIAQAVVPMPRSRRSRVVQLRLGDRRRAPDVHRGRLAAHRAGVLRDAADEPYLHVGRRVADAARQQRVDRAPERRVEQRHRERAVHDADRVVVLFAGIALEDDATFVGLRDAEVQQVRDRRRRHEAVAHRADRLESGHLAHGGGGSDRIVPRDEALASGLHDARDFGGAARRFPPGGDADGASAAASSR